MTGPVQSPFRESTWRWRLSGLSLIGIVIALVGGIWLVRTARFVTRASEVTGVVTRIEQDDGNMSEFHIAFSFTDSHGVVYTPETRFISPTFPALKAGDEVMVLYDKDAPNHAEVNSFATLWFEPLFVLVFGLFFALCGCLMLLAIRYVARHHQQRI